MFRVQRPLFSLAEDVTIEATRVRLGGRVAAMEVESPGPGVMRVRFAPESLRSHPSHPELPVKRSFAREGMELGESGPRHARRGLSVRVTDGDAAGGVASEPGSEALRIAGADCALELALADGAWRFFDAEGRCVASSLGYEGEFAAGYPMARHRARVALAAPEGEAYLGFGEKVGPLDKRGMRFTFWNTDVHPFPHTDPLYASIPFFIAVRDGIAWGLFLDEAARSRVDVAKRDPDRIVWEVEGPELDAYLIAGPRPEDVLRRYVALTGSPFAPPLFSLGAQQSRWGYESAEEVKAIVRGYRRRGLPLDVVYLDIDHQDGYRPLSWDFGRFPDPAGLMHALGAEGVRVVTIVDPGLKVDPAWGVYRDAKSRDFLVRWERGDELVGEVWPDPAVFPDFTRAPVRRWWASLHHEHVEAGVAGFWNDMNEPSSFSLSPGVRGIPVAEGKRAPGHTAPLGPTLPDEARHGDRRHIEVHNAYALGMARAAFDGQADAAPSRRPFVLTRAGYAGIQKYAAMWTGDIRSDWSHLEAALPMLLGMGASGLPFVGADVPGFAGDATGELLARFTQAILFAPLLRNHTAKGTVPQEPWRFGEPWLGLVREALLLRYRLLPSLYTAMMAAHETGYPPMAPLPFAHPGDPYAFAAYDQYLFARGLLVAPIVRPGQTKRMVYLPEGAWAPLTHALASEAVIEGGRHVVVDAPLDRLPMFLAAGHGLVATAPALHTTTAEWAEIAWHLHPGAGASVSLYEDRGDGPVDGTWTHVTATRTETALQLERTTRGEGHARRAKERIVLHATPPARRVEGAMASESLDHALVLDVAPDWTSVAIHF